MGKIVKTQSHIKLVEDIKNLLHKARNAVARNISTAIVMTYFEIGRMIMVHDRKRNARAGYARRALKNLNLYWTREFDNGFS